MNITPKEQAALTRYFLLTFMARAVMGIEERDALVGMLQEDQAQADDCDEAFLQAALAYILTE